MELVLMDARIPVLIYVRPLIISQDLTFVGQPDDTVIENRNPKQLRVHPLT